MPSLACAVAVAERRRRAAAPAGRDSDAGGGGGVDFDGSGSGRRGAAAVASAAALDLGSTFYMLNPSGDLAMTQAAFEERFASLPGWEVGPLIHCSIVSAGTPVTLLV